MSCKCVELHIGYRKCGKSEKVEQLLNSCNSKVYIATLPQIKKHENTIKNHMARRGNKWTTINLNFDFEADIKAIKLVLNNLPTQTACMLDGIWTWYYLQNQITKIEPAYFANILCELIENYCLTWKLVDIGTYIFAENNTDKNKLEIIHKTIINRLKITNLIDYRYERV